MFVPRSPHVEQADPPGRRLTPYLTDGVRLFRLLDTFRDEQDRPLRALENCCSLEVELIDADSFELRALRRVQTG